MIKQLLASGVVALSAVDFVLQTTADVVIDRGNALFRALVLFGTGAYAFLGATVSGDDAEQFVQLLIGLMCTVGLLYFSYIELINPQPQVSDRLFYTLVGLILASVGLREFQYRTEGKTPPMGGGSDREEP